MVREWFNCFNKIKRWFNWILLKSSFNLINLIVASSEVIIGLLINPIPGLVLSAIN